MPDRMTSLPQPFQGEGFLPPDERHIYDDTVHSLRMRGWSRMDAEDAAMKRILDRRDATQLKGQPDG